MLAVCLAGSARAATDWIQASGNYDNPANWTGASYGGGLSLGYSAGTGNQIVTLKTGGTITQSTFVGDNGQGTLNVQGGTLQSSTITIQRAGFRARPFC